MLGLGRVIGVLSVKMSRDRAAQVTLFLSVFFNRRIVAGMTAGAVKG